MGIRPTTVPRPWAANISNESTASFSRSSFILRMDRLHL